MASISKLSIRGIRSFSPNDSEQVISFTHPVTVIVGANGCGKTTIIESLKYAITGSLPPGNKSGQAFVHDPKSVGQSSVKGCIKLRFLNRAGGSMVVVRSCEVTQKKSTMSFKALDGILRTTDPRTGERVSMSHKCTELDRQIPALVGVSKAILEHVVFCHQEESSWPLMEGAVLKKRFDEIFDSTRYTKALDEIRKTRLKYVNQSKEEKAELEGLASHKFAAEGFRRELEDCEERLIDFSKQVEACEEGIATESEKMKEWEEILSKVDEMRDTLMEKEGNLDREKSVCEHVRSMLDKDLTNECSESQLKKMLTSFDETVQDEKKKLEKKEAEFERLKRVIARLNNDARDLLRQKDKLEGDRDQNNALVVKRGTLIQRMANDYNLPLPNNNDNSNDITIIDDSPTTQLEENPTSAPDISLFLSSVTSHAASIEEQLNNLRQNLQKKEDAIQSQLLEVKSKQSGIETSLSRISSEHYAARQKLTSLSSLSQSTAGGSSSRVRKSEVEEAQREAEAAVAGHKELMDHPRLTEIPSEIRSAEREMDSLKRKIEDETDVIQELRRSEGEQREVKLYEDQVRSEMEILKEGIKEQEFSFKKYNLDVPNPDHESLSKMLEAIQDKQSIVSSSLDKIRIETSQKQGFVTEKKTLHAHSQSSLESKQAEMKMLETNSSRGIQKIKRVIKGIRGTEQRSLQGQTHVKIDHDPQELVKYIDEKIQNMIADDESSSNPLVISRAIKKLKNSARVYDDGGTPVAVVCPCCRRDMNPDEAEVFQNTMNELSDPNTSSLIIDQETAGKMKQQRVQLELWRNLLTSSMTDHMTYQRLKKDCEEYESRLGDQHEEYQLAQADCNIVETQMKELEMEYGEFGPFIRDVAKLREDAAKIADKEIKIRGLKQKMERLVPNADGRSLKSLEGDLRDLQDEKERMQEKVSGLNKEMSKLNARISEASRYANDAEKIARDKEARYVKDQEMANKKQELNEKILKFSQEEKQLQEQIIPLRQQITSKQGEIQRLRSSSKSQDQELTSDLHKIRHDAQSLQSLHDQIEQFLKSDKLRLLHEVVEKITDKEAEIKSKEEDRQMIEPELEDMRSQGMESERRKKSIENNLHLLENMKKVKILEKELEQYRLKVEQEEDATNSREGHAEASRKRKQYFEEKARYEGRIAGLKEQKKILKRKLRTQEYDNVDERHRVKLIEYETSKIVVTDLDKYHKALDSALLRYHGMKIADINKIIRELWMLTYKGQDITNIQLVSGQDSPSSRASRSYNYRVVMTKGNTPLDMRGRCSAGQRVLASIVIRLALAETFCLNCGVMALDEPTTNLDYENKRGLAIALAQIIATRAVQHNFQLVVITHDEDFVAMLKNELSGQSGFDMPELFYQVSRAEGRDGKHYSKIDAVDWDEL